MISKTSKIGERKNLILGAILATILGLIIWQAQAEKTGPIPAKEIRARLDGYFSAMEENGDFSGVVLVTQKGETVFHKAFGYFDYENGSKTTLETRYPIASLTKTFISGTILYLVNDGKLDLDDPVSKFFPDFPRADEITIEFLLLHASGLENPDYTALAKKKEISPEELTSLISSKPLQFDPGTRSQYSNAGYNVLAAIIEKMTGQSLDNFLKGSFFTPLGMKSSENLIGNGEIENQAKGYLPGPGPSHVFLSPLNNYSLFPGSGSLIATAQDLELWLGAVQSKTYFDIFDPSFRWPFGWGKTESGGYQGLEQSGAVDGYRAAFQVFPEADTKVIVLSNINSDNWVKWVHDAALITYGGEAEPPLTPKPRAPENLILENYQGTYEAEGWTLHLRILEGSLWMFFDEFPAGKYLVPQADHHFAIAGAEGDITFNIDEESGMATSLEWDFGGGSMTATRSEEQ